VQQACRLRGLGSGVLFFAAFAAFAFSLVRIDRRSSSAASPADPSRFARTVIVRTLHGR